MSKRIKTLDGWCMYYKRTGKGNIYDYIKVGSTISEDIIDYFLNLSPPKSISYGYLQVGEPYNHIDDGTGSYKPIYLTFMKTNDEWKYFGICFLEESVDMSNY